MDVYYKKGRAEGETLLKSNMKINNLETTPQFS